MAQFLFFLLVLSSSFCLAQEFYGNPNGVDGFNQTKIGKALAKHNPWIEETLKSKQELDEYFRCHIAGGQEGTEKVKAQSQLTKFNVVYKPIIDLAVEHYGVPYALATCTLFRETLFNNKRNNKQSGARGMGQIMPQTYQEILKDMWEMVPINEREANKGKRRKIEAHSWASDYREHLQKLKDFEPDNPKNRCKEFSEYECDGGLDYIRKYTGANRYTRAISFGQTNDSVLYRSATKEERERSLATTKEDRNQFNINQQVFNQHQTFIWSYYRELRIKDPTLAARMFPNAGASWPKGPDLIPPDNIDDMTKHPVWVVATNLYLYKQMMLQADSRFEKCELKGDDTISFLMFLGGGYNGGGSRMEKTVGKGCRSVRKWCEEASGYTSETKNYMLSLRRCMTRGSNTGVTGQNPGACQGDNLPETHDPCEPIPYSETERVEPGDALENIMNRSSTN